MRETLRGARNWSEIAKTLPEGSAKTINRFIARHRLASLFNGIKAEGLSFETVRGYDAMFSVFLSYTAFELCFEGIAEYWQDKSIKDDERHEFELHDPALQKLIKNNGKLEHYLLHEKSDDALLARIHEFFSGYDSNLMPVLAGIRHKVAHGHLSVAGINADTKSNSEAILAASRLLLEAIDDLFYSFVRSIE